MATDAQNLKLNKVTTATKPAFSKATPASGSIYWDETEKRVVVGDGATAGGIGMAKDAEVKQQSNDLTVLKATIITAFRNVNKP